MSSHSLRFRNLTLLFLVSVSVFGLILVVLFAVHQPVSQEDFAWRKPVVGSAFSAVCVLGILAVFFPNLCSRFSYIRRREISHNGFFDFKKSASISHSKVSTLRGHHPQCGRFSAHIFHLSHWTFCATCSGLFLGAVVVLPAVGMYFFWTWQIGKNALLAVLFGTFGVVLGLLQSPLPILQNSAIRLFTSAYFTAGTFLILLGNEELAHSVSIDLFLVALSVLWLMTRISLSQWDHERVCSRCTLESCSLASKNGEA